MNRLFIFKTGIWFKFEKDKYISSQYNYFFQFIFRGKSIFSIAGDLGIDI